MKKLLALCLALAMLLPLCACGGSSGTITKEEMQSAAKKLNVSKLIESAEENELRASEEYVGAIYEISGFVTAINEDSCTLETLGTDGLLHGTRSMIVVPLSREELMELSTNERITVVGEIGEIVGQTIIKLRSAYYISNEFTLEVKITDFVYDFVSDKYPTYAGATCFGYLDESFLPRCNVVLSREKLAELEEGDEVTVKGKLVFYDENHVHLDIRKEKIIFEIQDAELTD